MPQATITADRTGTDSAAQWEHRGHLRMLGLPLGVQPHAHRLACEVKALLGVPALIRVTSPPGPWRGCACRS